MYKSNWFLVGLFLLLSNCVTKVDFKSEETQFIAINGVISNNPQERRITLFENIDSNQGIRGNLYKDGELHSPLDAIQRRTLQIPSNIIIEEGASYFIEIILDDGTVYKTVPQIVQPPQRPDSLTFEVADKLFQLENGKYEEGIAVNILAQMPVPDQSNPFFLRFQMDESWAYLEVDDPRVEDDPLFMCYIERGIRDFPSRIWTNDRQLSGNQSALVASRRFDQSFLMKHYFNVYTYTISQEAYTYYDNTQSIIENSGTLLDEIPAAIKGNVYKEGDADELIYGYVEFGLPDTVRFFIDGIVGLSLFNSCAVPNPCPDPVPFGPPPGCPCADCLLIEGGTYNKPSYFE